MTFESKIAQEEQAQTTYENGATARRVTLTLSDGSLISGSNPLPVDTSGGAPLTTAIVFQTVSTVADNTLTTILTFTATVAIFLDHVTATGEADGEYGIFINTAEKIRMRGTGSVIMVQQPMFNFKMAIGDIIDVKITHYRIGRTPDFQASLQYHE